MDHHSGAIRFTFPAELALNPKGFAGALAGIAEKLGCPKCFSGVDCLFQRQKDYLVDAKKGVIPQDPVPIRVLPVVGLAMPGSVFNDIEQIRGAAGLAFGKLGCLPCTSGFDVLFRNTIRTLTIDKKMNLAEFGAGR